MSTTHRAMTLCCREQWAGGIFRSVESDGDALVLAPGAVEGFALLPPVDAGESGFAWGRLSLQADIPGQCGIRVFARASDEPEWADWEGLRRKNTPGSPAQLFGESAGSGTELWLHLTGRWLWLAFELTGSGAQRPRVEAVSLVMEADHMTNYLPSIYQDQDFTYRYLSIFNSMFQDLERDIDGFSRQLNPESALPEMLEYLASWLCMEPEGTTEALRSRFSRILEEYEGMYTPQGIKRSVQRLTGVEPVIIEHFTVDPNSPECSDPALYRRLYGENPYRFFILLPKDTFASQDQMERFLEEMRELVPAETEFELRLLESGAQLDWQSYLGMNAGIGGYRTAVIDESMTIDYDTTIGGTLS